MDIAITPTKLRGSISVIPSKSQAHRLLICAAFADGETTLHCPETSRDMDATAECLNALGASIHATGDGYHITPAVEIPTTAHLFCHDSGSTLRFLLPIAGALGLDATFHLEGRLPKRPLSPLWEEMERMGCTLSRPTADTIRCQGKLQSGTYALDGSISSQFFTGLLLAFPLMEGTSRIQPIGKLESKPYVTMTLDAMKAFGVSGETMTVTGGKGYHSPVEMTVEGDWSNGAFFLAAQALGSDLAVCGLSPDSSQGDRDAARWIPALKTHQTIPAGDIPDLVPILSIVAACHQGAVFTDIRRLRLKESDRVASILAMLTALGGRGEATENTLTVFGTGLLGGTVDSCNDHRIAMSAAIAATVCRKTVTILDAQCVQKSYPKFWEEYNRLGGNYEQYLR